MNRLASKRIVTASRRASWLILAVACLLCSCLSGYAQTAEFTQNTSGSNAMTLQIPLGSYPGRGVSLPITLNYSTRGLWRIGFINSVHASVEGYQQQVRRSVTEAIYAEHSTSGWTTTLDIPKIEWPKLNDRYWFDGKPYAQGYVYPYTFRIARVFIHMPDGSTHEMRKADQVYQDNNSIDMSGTFYAVDGSRMRYDSTGESTGTLYLADGTRYGLNGSTTQYIDRNGNTLNYNGTNGQWTDTLGRIIGMPWPVNPGAQDYTYSLPGINETTINYTLRFTALSGALSSGSPAMLPAANHYLPMPYAMPTNQGSGNFPEPTQGASLFTSPPVDDELDPNYTYVVGHGQSGSSIFNPVVLSEIVLPNGQSYKFFYNIYGEIDKVIYPTGGYQRYQYGGVPTFGSSGSTPPYGQGSRGITSRWISPNGTGGADEAQWQYSASLGVGGYLMSATAPDGTRSETTLFNAQSVQSNNFGYEDARNGMPIEERVYAPQSQGGAMLRRSLTEYAITSATMPRPTIPNNNNPGTYLASRNARPIKTVSLMLDTGGDSLAKTVTYEYDTSNPFSTGLNHTASNESYFASVDQTTAQNGAIVSIPSGSLASRAETTYLNDSAYLSRNILGLPTSVVLKDGNSNLVSESESFYDEAAYPLLTYGDLTGADYNDPGTSARGNVTTAKRYSDVTAGLYLESHAQFDQCGNLRIATNERGIQSQVEYSATYKHAYATLATTAIPDPSGAHGSSTAFTSSTTFDYTTGLLLTTMDANGQTATFSYQNDQGVNDPLNRLRKVTRPDGGWTKYSFGETPGNLYTMTETKQDATRTVKTYQYVDPLGRATRSFASEGGNSYIASDTIYDLMGRIWKVSNPYRTTTLNGFADTSHTSDWTISHYDALSRVDSVTLPDASTVQTSYQGIYTTVTDQAGRQRRQKTDALGRIVRVDEPGTNGSLGTDVDHPVQPSYYQYNTQGNLIAISQGLIEPGQNVENPAGYTQHRYFKYDSLGRLTYERQVEQAGTFSAYDPLTGNSAWSRKLVYDETIGSVNYKGLLTTTTDARSINTQFRYDQLNRIYQVSYSDGTPTVTNYYDQAVAGYFNKGQLTQTSTAAIGSIPETTQSYNFDLIGRVKNNEQTVGDQSYTMSYSYNLGGALTSQTYPSGRVINYAFDDAARLSQVSSDSTIYANQFDYTSTQGLLKSVTMGNGAVESLVYNSRLQIKSLDLTKGGTQLQHYDYKYGVYDPATNTLDETKNNGKIARIEGKIAMVKQWQQNFAYDSLNRLSSAREFRGDNNQSSYVINYDYDVFGNRKQKQAQNQNNPFTQYWIEDSEITPATNRFAANVSYDYAGNVLTDQRFRQLKFQYDANNRQKQSSNLDNTGVVVSVYDAGGQRVATQVNNTLTNVLVYDAAGKLVAEYGSPASGGTQYLFSDHQGSPRAITNGSGTIVSRHDYLPFGDELGAVGMRVTTPGYGSGDNARQKYAGMEGDDATGMAHTLWRQYDSLSGRWTASDPYGGSMSVSNPQSFNRYSYVENNPVNSVDPSGLKLSDIGVYQTEDAEQAKTLQRKSDADWKKAINAEYAREHGGTVSYDENGNATFRSKYTSNFARNATRDMAAKKAGSFFSGLDATVSSTEGQELSSTWVRGPFVFPEVAENFQSYEGKVKTKWCATWVQQVAEKLGQPLGPASNWYGGEQVNSNTRPGTAIISGLDLTGKYPNNPRYNHAGFFLWPAPGGFVMLENIKGTVQIRSVIGTGDYFQAPDQYFVIMVPGTIRGSLGGAKRP